MTLRNMHALASSSLTQDNKLQVLLSTGITDGEQLLNAGFALPDVSSNAWTTVSFQKMISRQEFHQEVFLAGLAALKGLIGLDTLPKTFLSEFEDWRSFAICVLGQWTEAKIMYGEHDVTASVRGKGSIPGDTSGSNPLTLSHKFLQTLAEVDKGFINLPCVENNEDLLAPYPER